MNDGIELRFPPDPAYLRLLRQSVREHMERHNVAEGPTDRMVLIVDEMVSNSIEHGVTYRSTKRDLVVHLEFHGQDLHLSFVDPEVPRGVIDDLTRLLAACRGNLPPLESERGRGLFLIDDGLDDLALEGAPGGGMRMRGTLRGIRP
jgi:anti-sigma regulatory factor (Ser/Thr protein kinase)